MNVQNLFYFQNWLRRYLGHGLCLISCIWTIWQCDISYYACYSMWFCEVHFGSGLRNYENWYNNFFRKFGFISIKDYNFRYISLSSHLHMDSHESMMCEINGIYIKLQFFNGIDPIIHNLIIFSFVLTSSTRRINFWNILD